MSIEIEVLNADASWPLAEPLFKAIWPPQVVEKLPWGRFVSAYPEWRVLLQDAAEGVVCHVGLQRREVLWNGRKMRAGGVSGVLTREDFRRRGYASLALNAALQTLKDEGSTDFALLFCEPRHAAFYQGRGWQKFDGEIFCDQPEGRIRYEATAPYVYELRRAPRAGSIDLCGLPW